MTVESQTTYEVRFENGASHFISPGLTNSLGGAADIAVASIKSCVPEWVDIVRPTVVRFANVCAICGKPPHLATLRRLSVLIGANVNICTECLSTLHLAR